MTPDDRDISALAYLAHRIRGWDRPGIEANIRKIAHLPLADVALAVVRAADDPAIGNPGVLANPRSTCWKERATDRPTPREPFDPARVCGICGKHEATCRAIPESKSDHTFKSTNDVRRDQRRREESAT